MNPAVSDAERLRQWDVGRVLAANPGPLTLTGTNSWVVGRDPAWVVDPGPAIAEHLQELYAAIDDRGGLGGVALTHDHQDHSESARTVSGRYGAPLAGGRGSVDLALAEGARV